MTSGPREGDVCLALEHIETRTGQYRDAGSDVSFDSRGKRFRPDEVLFCKLRPYLAKVARQIEPVSVSVSFWSSVPLMTP